MKSIWVIPLIASILIIGAIGFSFNFENSNLVSEESVESNFVDTIVEPQISTVESNEMEIEVTESVVTPEISTVDSVSLANTQSANYKTLLTLFPYAFGFPSDQLIVTLDEWTVAELLSERPPEIAAQYQHAFIVGATAEFDFSLDINHAGLAHVGAGSYPRRLSERNVPK